MKNSYKKLLADDMVSEFRKKFYGTFGVYPTVHYSFNKGELPRVTLKMLEDLVNSVMEESHPEVYTPSGIRLRTRKRELVLYRQIFLKIAHDINYGPSLSSGYIGYSHSLAIHHKTVITELLETNDPLATSIYNTIIDAYKKRFDNDGDVQQDSSS